MADSAAGIDRPDASSTRVEPEASAARSNLLPVAGTAALTALISFFHLASYGLWEPDEARYAEIAREMLARHDFLVPHLNYVIYVEKPPLLYWLTALSFSVFGESEFAARFFVAVFAVVGVAATSYWTLRVFDRRRAWLAGAILATSPLYAVMAQVLTTDMILACLVTIASFALYLHWREGGSWCWLAYIAIGLGALTKGPVAIGIPLLTIAIFLAWQRNLRGALRRFHTIAGFVLVLAIAAPWFVAVALRVPGFLRFYFVGEHLRRTFEFSYSHGEPIWFYIPVLIAGLLPWAALVPLFAWRGLTPNPARRFCIAMATVTIVGFSLASAKLIPYILPAVAPLAVLIADGVAMCAWPTRDGEGRPSVRPPDTRIIAEAGPLLSLIGVGAFATALFADQFRTPYPEYARPALYAVGAILLAGGAIATVAAMRRRAALALEAIVLTMTLALMAGSWARLEAEPLRSYATLARAVAARAPDATFICYHRYVQALAFYGHRRVVLVGGRTELAFGANLTSDASEHFLSSDDDLLRIWNLPGDKVLVLDEPDLERLALRLAPFAEIGAEYRKRAIRKGNGTSGNN